MLSGITTRAAPSTSSDGRVEAPAPVARPKADATPSAQDDEVRLSSGATLRGSQDAGTTAAADASKGSSRKTQVDGESSKKSSLAGESKLAVSGAADDSSKSTDSLSAANRRSDDDSDNDNDKGGIAGSKQDDDSDDTTGLTADKKDNAAPGIRSESQEQGDGQSEELLFGLKADPYSPDVESDEKKEEAPPPPVVGVEIAFGRPTFAPVQPEEVDPKSSDEANLPIGLRGPFTTAQDEEEQAQAAGRFGPAVETDDPFAQALLARAARAKEEEALAVAEKQRAEQAAAAGLNPVALGIADGAGIRVAGEIMPSSRVNGTRSPYATSAQGGLGRDAYRQANEETQGPFGSTGKVAQYVAAYLRQSEGASASPAAGQVVSTVG